jgi:hypothetical protein
MNAGREVWCAIRKGVCNASEGLAYLVSAKNFGVFSRQGRTAPKLFAQD